MGGFCFYFRLQPYCWAFFLASRARMASRRLRLMRPCWSISVTLTTMASPTATQPKRAPKCAKPWTPPSKSWLSSCDRFPHKSRVPERHVAFVAFSSQNVQKIVTQEKGKGIFTLDRTIPGRYTKGVVLWYSACETTQHHTD